MVEIKLILLEYLLFWLDLPKHCKYFSTKIGQFVILPNIISVLFQF